jgi:hypothetical protein
MYDADDYGGAYAARFVSVSKSAILDRDTDLRGVQSGWRAGYHVVNWTSIDQD